MSNRKKVLLIDGNNLLFRAFYAYSQQFKSQKIGSNAALYGFAKMLNGFLKRHHYFDVVVAFDDRQPTFRHQLSADYKAQRPQLPVELINQFELARKFLTASNIYFFSFPGYEADDILMTLSQKATNSGYQVDILSGDRDLYQAISPHVRILSPIRGLSHLKSIDIVAFHQEYGFAPNLFADYKALVGDSSDNFKGVVGIGPAKARELIVKYGRLEDIMVHRKVLPARIEGLLYQYEASARRCKKLATLISDLDLKYQFQPYRLNKLAQNIFFRTYHFPSLMWSTT